MKRIESPPWIVRWTLRLEQATPLDRPVRALEPAISYLFGNGARGWALRGEWLGHALHPVLTDIAVGSWVSGSVLDLLGGPDAVDSARKLTGVGVLAAVPTAWTGWAEWSAVPLRDKRVGLVHALVNGTAIGVYASSWVARRRGRHRTGARLALAGATVAGVGAYLGGHLTEARNVASHHPAFDDGTRKH